MKNRLLIIFLSFLFITPGFAENIQIEAKNITLDKDKITSIFENEVSVKTENEIIKSDYVKYNKKLGFLILKGNITAIDNRNNTIEANYAEYSEKNKIFKTSGPTKLITSENYILEGEDIIIDNNKRFVKSIKDSTLKDQDGNEIYLENFEYQTTNNIFRSIGSIKINDKLGNNYQFSQIYIDTKKKEILGTDAKVFLTQENFKIDKRNKPRVFSNSVKLSKNLSSFDKSVFTICDYRENDKCPPWSIQSTKMLHDNTKKTIYYDNAVVKIYDIPIFYLPRLSHPDPTVARRSGFLPPSLFNSKNLGSGLNIPYFFDLAPDKNFTLKSRFYSDENPLFLGEYHQAFENSSLIADFGYTEGYKKVSAAKRAGEKSHLFSKFTKNFVNEDDGSDGSFSIIVQDVSNDKYLKLYKIDSNLVDYNTSTLENSFNFNYQNDDLFLGLHASAYETLKDDYVDKYEYIFPEITLDKNLFSNNIFGTLDLQSNLKIHNYDTNKLTQFLVNDFNWNLKEFNFNSGLRSKVIAHIKNINYEAKNVSKFKKETTNELYGAFGYLTEINLQKQQDSSIHSLKPKLFLRFSPGSMRKESSGSRLDPINAFNIDRLNNKNNFETGMSSTVGFDYTLKNGNKNFDFSVAQIINEKENKKMHSKTSLDEKLSDLVGSAKLSINNKTSLNYNFALDENYNDLNYNEIGASFDLNPVKVNFDYLKEMKHIGNQEYFKTKIDLENSENTIISFENKRNLITNSSEFYNLSYEYVNDCLRAGLVYRREFYTDSELEPENSLMFKITIVPFGDVTSPSFN